MQPWNCSAQTLFCSLLVLVILCHIPPPPKFILSCSHPLWEECFLWTTLLAPPLPSGFQLGLSLGGTGRRSRGGRRKKLGVFLPLPPHCIVQQFCGSMADHFCGSPPSVHGPSCRSPLLQAPPCGNSLLWHHPLLWEPPSCRHPSCGSPSHAGAPLLWGPPLQLSDSSNPGTFSGSSQDWGGNYFPLLPIPGKIPLIKFSSKSQWLCLPFPAGLWLLGDLLG